MIEEKIINILKTVIRLSEEKKASLVNPELINLLNNIKIFIQKEN